MSFPTPSCRVRVTYAPPVTVPDSLTVSVLGLPDHVVVELRGEVDLATAGLLRDRFDGLIPQTVGSVVVDASDLSFLDSTGLSVLVDVDRRLSTLGRSLLLRNVNPPVRRVLEITGLFQRFCRDA